MTGANWLTCREQAEWAAVAGRFQGEEHAALQGIGPSLTAWCALCERRTMFHGLGAPLQFREGIVCANCGCNARQRAAGAVLLEALAGTSSASVSARFGIAT